MGIETLMRKPIDKRFLDKHTSIKNALYHAGIRTYSGLFAKAKQKYNLFFINYLGPDSVRKIQYHVLGKLKKGLPNYKKNLRDFKSTEK